MTREEREEHLVRHYIRAFRLVTIYCGRAAGSGKTLVGYCRNLEAWLAALEAEHGAVTLDAVWWLADEGRARAITTTRHFSGTAAAAAELPKIAAQLRTTLTTDTDVRARARAGIEGMRKAAKDQLRFVNAEYRELRFSRAERGLKTLPYAVFVQRHEIRLIYRSIATAL